MKIAVFFHKDSEALFNIHSTRTFGGASVQMYNIAKELHNHKGITTYSIIPEYKKIDFNDMDKFCLQKIYNEKDIKIVKLYKFIQFLIKTKPDAVIQRGLTTESCIVAILCWILKIKFVFMFAHDVEVNGLRQSDRSRVFLFFLLRKYAYKLITQNRYQMETLLQKYRTPNTIIYSGYDIVESKIRKKSNGYILWVARCDTWKQPELFIQLAQSNPSLRFCMICPKSQDEQFFENIRKQALKVKNLLFINFVPYHEIDNYFKKAFLFINTSLYEGFPQTFIQATMYAVPIITLHVNPEDFLDVYKCGFCCNGNLELMNKKIQDLCNDKKLYKMLSDNAYNYAYVNHNITVNVKKIIGLLK